MNFLSVTAPRSITLLVRHAYVLTMDDAGNIIEDGAIAIDGGRIVAVGDDATIAARYSAARVIDAHGAPVHPGLVECHLHASFQVFRGSLPDQLVETDAFDTFESVFFNTVNDEEEYLARLRKLHSDKFFEYLNLYRKDWQKREKV